MEGLPAVLGQTGYPNHQRSGTAVHSLEWAYLRPEYRKIICIGIGIGIDIDPEKIRLLVLVLN